MTPNEEPTTGPLCPVCGAPILDDGSMAFDPRATATPGLDVERLEKAFVRVIDRRPTKVEVAYFYGDSIPVEHQREAFLRNVAAEYAALHPDKDSSR